MIRCLIEAFLFSSPHPVALSELVTLTRSDVETVEKILIRLTGELEEKGSALAIRRVASQWQMVVKPEYGSILKEHTRVTVKKGISKAALEVLAIVSLDQPVTKIQIDIKRGVDSGTALKVLLERGLVTISGYASAPGKPFLYGLTDKFYHIFGIEDQEALQRIQKMVRIPGNEHEIE